MRPPGRAARVPEGVPTPSPTTATASASSAPPVGSPLSPLSKEASVPRHQLQEGHRQVRSIATVATREYFGIWPHSERTKVKDWTEFKILIIKIIVFRCF